MKASGGDNGIFVRISGIRGNKENVQRFPEPLRECGRGRIATDRGKNGYKNDEERLEEDI